jgi:hypothetical protein
VGNLLHEATEILDEIMVHQENASDSVNKFRNTREGGMFGSQNKKV